MLAYITGSVDQELLRRNEYLVAENRVLRAHIPGRVNLTDGERRTLAEIGKQLGRKALAEVASVVRPETIFAWHRRMVAKKFDGSARGKDNLLLFPTEGIHATGPVRCREHLGGLLKFYHRAA